MSSATSTRRQQFEVSFNAPFPPKATYHDNINIWNAAPQELKDEYIHTGYSDAGLWKNFRREVMARCLDGKVSGKRLTTLNEGIKKEVVEVKRELEVIYVLD